MTDERGGEASSNAPTTKTFDARVIGSIVTGVHMMPGGFSAEEHL